MYTYPKHLFRDPAVIGSTSKYSPNVKNISSVRAWRALSQPINWLLLGKAVEFYVSKGFKYIDVPWDTSFKVQQTTFHDTCFNSIDKDRYLVGSGEQGFLQIWDLIPPGRYVTCTPCFRMEKVDNIHSQYFMKVELFANEGDAVEQYHAIKNIAHYYMMGLANEGAVYFTEDRHPVNKLVLTPDVKTPTEILTCDIESEEGVEYGSYGIRTYFDNRYAYGTGLALPRFGL